MFHILTFQVFIFFRSRKQTIYCNDSVLQINSSILWVIGTVNPFHTAFQLHSIQWITSLAMLCYTNFLSNFNLNTMVGVISDSSPKNTAVKVYSVGCRAGLYFTYSSHGCSHNTVNIFRKVPVLNYLQKAAMYLFSEEPHTRTSDKNIHNHQMKWWNKPQ